jgi:protein-disulfide isomerase
MITRRQTLQLLGTAAVTAYLATSLPAFAQSVSTQELAVEGPLGDTWPELKKRYIDTGKVRFVLREFPLDPLATAGFMLARCDGNDKYYPITDLLFEQQRNWAFVEKPLDALRQIMRQAGFSQEKFDACLQDQKLYDAVNAVKNRGMEEFNVNSTPTFFINGERHPGSLTIDELEKTIKPMLGE